MKILFMGTPDFAKESLEALYNNGFEIVGVVTNVDKPKGRGMKMLYTPVKEYALEKGLKVFQPEKIRNNEEFYEEIKSLNPDVLCVVAYGKILPTKILEIGKYGAINVHGSLLPKYRGAAPIQWAVLNGDKTTGITTMFMDAGMDTGDMILKEEVEIGENETTGELWTKLSTIGAQLLVKTINKIQELKDEVSNLEELKEKIGAQKQSEDFTIAPMLNKEMSKIDWTKSASEIHNLVRGLNPIMGAYTYIDNKKIKIWKTQVILNSDNTEPGTIIEKTKKQLIIKAGENAVEVLEIQPENSKKMNAKDFLNGKQIISDKVN